ncbi:hypothetical protein UlMin_009829 [Ulmus minor]
MLSLAQNVAGKVTSVVSSAAQNVEERVFGLFTSSDEKILDQIYSTHVHAEKTFDEDSLFLVVENVLNHATQIVAKVVQGSQVHVDNIEEFTTPKGNLNVPLCTLKKIGCELSCKAPSEEVAHKTTLAILNKLSTYTWEAKGVLALGAFALEFGDFWLLAQLQKTDQLAKSLGILKRVPNLLKPSELPKRRQAVLELSNLIKTTMHVIKILDEFEKLSSYDPKDVPALASANDHIPVDVYWAIVAIVAVSTKITILTSDEPDKPYDLSPYAQKIHFILNNLNMKLTICRTQLAEAEAYRGIRKLFQTPTEVMEIFKALLFTKDNVQPLIDGSTNRTVQIDVLRRKYVFTLISSLDISETDILLLKPVYELTKKDTRYTIVWIPIVEQWTDELRKKFDILRSKMPWYVVPTFTSQISAGIRFIRVDWQFKGKPMLVALNPQGRVENINAFFLLRSYGIHAFPFDRKTEIEISNKSKWIDSAVKDIHPSIQTWIKEEKYIFFYGGKDNEWIQQFTKKATALANDPYLKDLKINIELFCVGKTAKGGEDHGMIGKFWGAIEGLFLTKAHKQVDPVTQEIQKLLSYKNDSGWALLSKGSTVVTTGHGYTFLRVFEEFDKWKESVKEKGFELTFKENYAKTSRVVRQCCRLDVPAAPGKIPEVMNCPECPQSMEMFVTYKCCHIDDSAGSHH